MNKKTQKTHKRAVIYTRSAAHEERAGNYAREQEKACREFAKENDYEVVKVFDDTGTDNRKAKDELISFCSDSVNKIEAVIAVDIERIGRAIFDQLALHKMLSISGIKLVTLKPHILTKTGEQFRMDLMAAIARYDRDVRSLRIKAGIRNKKNRKNS